MSAVASNQFIELLPSAVIDFSSDTFMICLMSTGFVFNRASHEIYADISAEEHANGNGYTTGGAALAGVAITRSDVSNTTSITWNNASWIAAGGNFEADGAIIYDDTVAVPVVKPIIGYINFDATILTYDGGTMTVANPTVTLAHPAGV